MPKIILLVYDSFSFNLAKKTWKTYLVLEAWLTTAFKNSKSYLIFSGLSHKLKAYSRESSLVKIINEICEKNGSPIFEGSIVINRTADLIKKQRAKLKFYLKTSQSDNLLAETKKELLSSPLKITSRIAVIAVITNITLSFSINRPPCLSVWIVEAVILFIGLNGISSETTWEEIKKTSKFIKFITP